MTGLASAASTPATADPEPLGPIAKMIEGVRSARRTFRSTSLFQVRGRADEPSAATRSALRDGLVLTLDSSALSSLLSERPEDVLLVLPGLAGGTVELELTRAKFLASSFRVVASSAPDEAADYDRMALHYWGVVKGDRKSLAAVSVFQGEVMGTYRTADDGPVVLGRVAGSSAGDHVLYAEKDLLAPNPFACSTKDDADNVARAPDGMVAKSKLSSVAENAAPEPEGAQGCVRIYVEADYDLFANKGSVAAVVNYVTGIFSQSAILYQNESVPISVSEIFVWNTTPTPYTGINDSAALLEQFQAVRTSFNGDLGHLLALRGGGGIAAGFSGFCSPNPAASQCFSGIEASYQNVPTFSWTVQVVTHEMGHLMGSRHTHACVWNGDGTAIDGCSGYVEGTCPLPGIPPTGGTIMSYCHWQDVGINFNNGFGPQPGTVIRAGFAGCITGCGGSPPLEITQHPANRNARIGSGTSFSVAAGGGTVPYTYRWQYSAAAGGPFNDLANGGGLSGATTATLTVNPVSASRAGFYRGRVSDSSPSVQQVFSNAAQLTASAALVINQQPAGLTRAPGASASFSVAAAGVAPLSYRWQFGTSAAGPFSNLSNGGAISGAGSATLTINPVATSHDGYYRCRVTDAGPSPNQILSNAARLTVDLAPAAPSGLFAWFEIAPRRIRLNWTDNSNNEQGFNVQFSYSGSAFSDLSPPTVGANVTSYATGANPPTGSYQFRVRSFAGGLYSPWSNLASLIVITPVSGYQGCYTDSATRALPVQLAGTTHTIETCKQAAYNAGYQYAGVQYYGYCFGGNSLGYSLVADSECNTPCTSNQLQMCGGAWRNSIYATGYLPPNPATASIAWIQPAENSWGPPGTLTAAGYAANGTGGVQLVWRERSSTGVWGPWTVVPYQPPPSPDTTWSNTISSGNPTNQCHWFDAYVNYSGVTSAVYHYTGWTGCP